MRHQGQISEWNDERGFGFVRPLEGAGRVFVHVSAFPHGSRRPSAGEIISYEISQDDHGRPRASNVIYTLGRPLARGRRRRLLATIFATAVATAFLALVVLAVNLRSLPRAIIVGYLLASILTYLAYANDKRAAQTGRWRTAEGTLLLLGLAGGWPGGLIAQHRFRHKTRKVSFQVAYWLTVGLHCMALWLLRGSLTIE